MPVVLFDCDIDQHRKDGFSFSEHAIIEAKITSSIFVPHQRPRIRFAGGPADVVLQDPAERLAVAMPIDALEALPHIIDPEVHYKLLSKHA